MDDMEAAIKEIWEMFRATDARLEKLFAETDRRFAETDARLEKLFAETDRRFAETDARLGKLFAETDRRFAETDRRLAEDHARAMQRIAALEARDEQARRVREREFKALQTLFTGQWGRLIEALVRPDALRLFRERGIPVVHLHRRIESYVDGRKQMEIDLLLENEEEIVVVEVKTSLGIEEVKEFLQKMKRFTEVFSRYKGYRIYGAVAGLDIAEGVDRFAYRRGLFVLAVSGEGLVRILNDEKFRPRDFGRDEEGSEEGRETFNRRP